PHPEHGPALPQAGEPGLRLLRRIAAGVDPESLDAYRAHGGYAALRRAIELGPAGVLREVSDSRLLGRGGAAFPTGAKWEAVARQPVHPHYLVCNADESEPGTFKDRVLMEDDPFALVEAMTIAAFATGCEQGFVYVRAEYPVAPERLEHAFAQPRTRVLLGGDGMGTVLAVGLELRIGGGADLVRRPGRLDLPLTFEGARAAGARRGSGVVVVYDESAELVDAVLRIAEFLRDESCGQCVPCRVGTVQQEEALHRLASGTTNGDERAVLADLTQVMRDASICGLGQTAANAVESAMMNLGVLA